MNKTVVRHTLEESNEKIEMKAKERFSSNAFKCTQQQTGFFNYSVPEKKDKNRKHTPRNEGTKNIKKGTKFRLSFSTSVKPIR